MDRPQVTSSPRPRSVWLNYAVLVYTAVALGAVLWVGNAIVSDHNLRFDLTPNKQFSLSEFDKRVLGSLKHPVKVMAFVRTEDPAYLQLESLLIQSAAFTPELSYQVIDVNKAPGLARQYGVSSYGEVVVEYQGRRRDFDNARSDLLIPAILQASNESNKHIYFTVGHGERDLFGTDRTTGFSTWRNLLDQNNYQVDNVSLFAGGVPDDAKVLVTLGPRKDFLPEELAAVAKYLANGGHFVAMIDPYGSPSLVTFLKQYHLDFTDQVIVDPAYRLSGGEVLTTQIPIRSEDNAISRAMPDAAVFSYARGVMITGDAGATAPGALVVQRVSKFLQSSHESWASGDVKAMTTGITEYQAGRDLRGPIPVGAEIDLAPANKEHEPVQSMTRIVGLGSSEFASNSFVEMMGNRDLAISTMNELAGDEMLIASRERLVKAETAAFYVTDQQARHVLIFGAILQPLTLFGIGALVFVRRRFFS